VGLAPSTASSSRSATVDAEATGKPSPPLEALRADAQRFLWAGLYAFIAMVLVLGVRLGSVKHTLVALLPLAMGMIATLGINDSSARA